MHCCLQINDWLVRARDANPGELPGLPSASEGGCKRILEEAATTTQSVVPPAAAQGTKKAPGKAAQPPAKKGKVVGKQAETLKRYMKSSASKCDIILSFQIVVPCMHAGK